MNDKMSLKELESKAFLSYQKDGLLDIVIGFILLVGVLSSTLSEQGVSDTIRILSYVPLIIMGPALIFYYGKKKITIPRLGHVIFGPKRKRDRKKLIAAILIINLVILYMIILY